MKKHCNDCGAFLCMEDEEIPSKCSSCGAGVHRELETRELFTQSEIRRKNL